MICFAWGGFPQYAARLVGAFVKSTDERVCVVGKPPAVAVEGMEKCTGCEIHWVQPNDTVHFVEMFGEMPDVLFVSGWHYPVFNRLRDEAIAAGVPVYCLNDANYVKLSDCSVVRLADWAEFGRQLVRAVVFRLKYRKLFDGFLVPGKSGRRLLRFYGVPDEKIAEGVYSADASLFDPDKVDAAKKEKRIVYVGQYIDRKNVLAVCEAFGKSGIAADGWSLEMYGSGPLKAQIPYAQPFVQPEQLPEIYRRARAFVLASKEEHWGLVVHEAALSGCYLMLSNRVGAADDLLGEKNGVKFNPFRIREMIAAFRHLAEMDEEAWGETCRASVEMGKRRGLGNFVEGVERLKFS